MSKSKPHVNVGIIGGGHVPMLSRIIIASAMMGTSMGMVDVLERKPSDKTQHDLDCLAKAQAKRDRKAKK